MKGDAWRALLEDDFLPRLERMWREQDYLHPRAVLGYFPCYSEGNEIVVLDPGDRETELERLVFPRQPGHDRICIADFFRPRGTSQLDVVALQAVTAGDAVTELMAALERDGEFAEQLFVHGLGVQTAEGMAEWLHAAVRDALGIPRDQGRRYSWGYPACPEQSEHEKVFRLLDAPAIGLRLSGGYAVEPEQSTLALVAHHPEAVYFGMRSGFLPKEGRQAPDEVIAGTSRDPSLVEGGGRRRGRLVRVPVLGEAHALGERQLVGVVDRVGRAAHVGAPGVRAGLPAAAGVLLAAERAADLGAGGADVDVDDAAVRAVWRPGTARPRAGRS